MNKGTLVFAAINIYNITVFVVSHIHTVLVYLLFI